MLYKSFLAVAAAVAIIAGCNKGEAPNAGGPASVTTLSISPEDLVAVGNDGLSAGPAVTGSIQPQRRADLRAEVSSVVREVLKENGAPVRQGDVLIRLDDDVIRESLLSAQAGVRTATQSVRQAETQLQRLKTLRDSGMATLQQFEEAEIRRSNAQNELIAAKARAAQAAQQLERTVIRAPFQGIISERKVSVGDTVQLGKELLKVIDPTSMRFEALVSADRVANIKEGQPVYFRVAGAQGRELAGTVSRIAPAANPVSRQVEVLVDFTAPSGLTLPAGLYAEGRIETGGAAPLTIPAAAIERSGDQAYAWRVAGGIVQKVPLKLGERDPRRGNFIVLGGLSAGDKVVRHPGSTLKDGQKVALQAASAGHAPRQPDASVEHKPLGASGTSTQPVQQVPPAATSAPAAPSASSPAAPASAGG